MAKTCCYCKCEIHAGEPMVDQTIRITGSTVVQPVFYHARCIWVREDILRRLYEESKKRT